MSYPHLLSPGRIGTMSLRNRILMCPMGDDQATDGGYVTPQQVAYFEARAIPSIDEMRERVES